MKRLLAPAALVAIPLAVAACGSSQRASGRSGSGSEISARTASSSGLILHRQVRCTAALTTPVRVGHALGVTYGVHNLTHHAVKIQLGYGSFWLVVTSPDGTRYDSRVPLRGIGPMIAPVALRAGATKTVTIPELRVRWSGPLRITPGCENTALPPLRVGVTTPGPPRDERTALADVVAASGHLLDRCRPTTPGVAVTGRIYPPRGSAPPMAARCSVSLERRRGFLLAQVLVLVPPGLKGFAHIQEPYESLQWFKGVGGRTAEAVAWEFVVTRDGATSVDSTSVESTRPADRMAPDWQFPSSPSARPGGSRCGGTGGGGGGYAGPLVEFVWVCPH